MISFQRQSAITIIYQSEYCNAKHVTTWLYVALGYKALILLVGCFIAMATRKVKARALNDSQFIGASIFVIMIAAFIESIIRNHNQKPFLFSLGFRES